MKSSLLRVVIIQRLCPHYRIPLFKRLSQQAGIDVTVVVNDPSALELKKEDLGFNLVYLPAWTIRFSFGAKNYHIPLSFSLIKHLRQSKYDVVISEGATNVVNNLIIYPLARFYGSKYIWWDAGRRRFAERNILRKMADPLIHYLIKSADANIAYGSVAKDYMVSAGVAPHKIFVAQNTIDTTPIFDSLEELINQSDKIRQELGLNGKKVILYVGAVERRKKIKNLILAYQEARKRMDKPIALVIVGDGTHLAALKTWVKNDLSLLDVYFTGQVIDGVGAYFFMCDLFALPSEGGLALNQAMAYGKPVIATSADGTEVDLIKQGENGYIVDEDNIPSLSNAIIQIIQNSEKQRAMGLISEKLMREKFTLENMIKGFLLSIHK